MQAVDANKIDVDVEAEIVEDHPDALGISSLATSSFPLVFLSLSSPLPPPFLFASLSLLSLSYTTSGPKTVRVVQQHMW